FRVVLEMKNEMARGPEALASVYVRSSGTSALVPLSSIARFTPAGTLVAVNHQGPVPRVTISFNAAPRVALRDAVEAIRRAEQEIGLPASIQASFSGTAQAFADSLKSEPFLILAALITVYIVLGMLYESTIHPITILSTLPSAGVGALLALLIFKIE